MTARTPEAPSPETPAARIARKLARAEALRAENEADHRPSFVALVPAFQPAPPFAPNDTVIFRKDPDTRATVTGCTLTRHGWSVAWRAEPAVPGVTAATGCCPAERLLPAAAM